jgi:Na+/proline symporter
LGRPLVLLIGIGATLFSLVVGRLGNIFEIMVSVVNTFGGPLLSIFLLGIFTRRVNGRAALLTLVAGTVFTVWLTGANQYPSLAFLWPFAERISGIWPLVFSVPMTLMLGYLLSFVVGRPKTRDELRGLVWGIGKLGVRDAEEAEIEVLPPQAKKGEPRWK